MKHTMKALIALAIASAVAVSAAFAEAVPEQRAGLNGRLEDGAYYLDIPMSAGDDGAWYVTDNDTVNLEAATVGSGSMTLCYTALRDGKGTMYVRHMRGSVCDRLFGYDFTAENGMFVELTGGSYTESPSDEDMAAVMCGEWLEKDTQFTAMTLARKEGRGFTVEITSPLTHGAYVFKASLDYNCEKNGFVYQDGAYYNVPVTEEADPDLGEPVKTECSGLITLCEDGNGCLMMNWLPGVDMEEQNILFVPAE